MTPLSLLYTAEQVNRSLGQLQRIAAQMRAVYLPEVSCFHLGCAGLPIDNFGAYYELHILLPCRGASRTHNLSQMGCVDQELSSRNCTAPANACGHDRNLARIVVGESGHNRVI